MTGILSESCIIVMPGFAIQKKYKENYKRIYNGYIFMV